jgi:hypothetical protein
LPIALRSLYILNVYEKAASAYVPDIYAGRLVVFKPAEETESAQAWQRFAGGDFEVHETFGNHTDVVNKEACVGLWAEQLRTYLEAYRTTYRKFPTSTVIRKEHELQIEPAISRATVLTASV